MKKYIISACVIVLSIFGIHSLKTKNLSNVIEKIDLIEVRYPKSSKYDSNEINTIKLEYKDLYSYIKDEKITKLYTNRNPGTMPRIVIVGHANGCYVDVHIYSNGYINIVSLEIEKPRKIKNNYYKLSNSSLYDSLYDFLSQSNELIDKSIN